MTAATVRYMPRYWWLNMDRVELTWEALMPRNARIRLAGIATADTNPTATA